MWIFRGTRAFTFIELIFVLVVIGVLAGLAIPRFSHTLERSRTAEAINILAALRDAQEVYNFENGAYTATIGNLDVTIPASKNFQAPTTAAANPIASIQRNAGGYNYTLTVDSDGTVKCAGVAPANICARLGCAGGAGSDQCN